jgi:uncharacterized membrane protein
MAAVLFLVSGILTFSGLTLIWTGIATIWLGIGIIGIIGGVICCVIGFILALLAVKHIRNCFNALAECSGENLFNTAATLIWVGALLTIIGVGIFLIWIGFIIAAIGFFTLKNNRAPPAYSYTAPPSAQQPSASGGSKSNFCPTCGAPIVPEATFCANCGKQV